MVKESSDEGPIELGEECRVFGRDFVAQDFSGQEAHLPALFSELYAKIRRESSEMRSIVRF